MGAHLHARDATGGESSNDATGGQVLLASVAVPREQVPLGGKSKYRRPFVLISAPYFRSVADQVLAVPYGGLCFKHKPQRVLCFPQCGVFKVG